jgi:acetyl-CoA carboxylase carboxyl transferase subunit alpha
MRHFLEFEKPIAELEGRIEELRRTTDAGGIDVAEEVAKLRDKAEGLLRQTYAKLTPWQKTLVARHPERPKCLDYVAGLIEEWTPLAGDRAFGDDAAVIGGLGRFRGQAVAVLGTEKGHDTDTRVQHNFGMARPEGYRKARRIMELAGRFGLPILSFVDTSGAFPASRPRRAARPRPSPARSRRGSPPRCPSSPPSSARAARAAPSRWPRPTAC